MSGTPTDSETLLAEDLARTYDDPLGWVQWAFDWGQGDLTGAQGPRIWQRESLERIGEEVRQRDRAGTRPAPPIQMSTASGHGIGKSALTAWIILWLLSTRPRAKGVVTANTADQLRTKTWGELAKWHRMSIVREMFAYHGGKGHLSLVSTEQPQLWRCDGMTCREENSEAFAGLHAADSTPFYIFDEASAVPDAIWDVALGGLTDGEPMFFAFGNPTRNTGRFRETHGSLKHRWITRQIDSRNVEGTNKALFAEWEEDFGEDGDFFRVRVRGMFPRASSLQFIDSDAVAAAMKRKASYGFDDPLVLGIDIARGGDDNNVIWFRRGMDARTIPPIRIPGQETRDTTRMIAKITTVIEDYKPDGVFIDGTGIGGPLVDRIRQLGFDVFEVQFGGAAPGRKYANMAAYMWARMKDALRTGLALPEDATLEAELTTREYTHNAKDQLVLERKEDMKKRGLASPDNGDALALTFAMPVVGRGQAEGQAVGKAIKDYDPLAD